RLAAAVVELNALPDAVRSAAEDHDAMLAGGGPGFVIVHRLRLSAVGQAASGNGRRPLVRRVVVRRVRLELGGAGIHALERRHDTHSLSKPADLTFIRLPEVSELPVGEPV